MVFEISDDLLAIRSLNHNVHRISSSPARSVLGVDRNEDRTPVKQRPRLDEAMPLLWVIVSTFNRLPLLLLTLWSRTSGEGHETQPYTSTPSWMLTLL